jgi:hypothetical protein
MVSPPFNRRVNFPRAPLGLVEGPAEVGEGVKPREHPAERDGGEDRNPDDDGQARKGT